jgi:ribosomal protein S18 acetylase RimI-like enzyme
MVTAWDEGELVGFARGYGLNGDTRWWEGMLTPVADEFTREWDGRTFVVIDMAVACARQHRGIGRHVLGSLLASRAEERASLAVVPGNENAHGFYRHLGWECIGRVEGEPRHTAPFFDIYVLNLR